MAAPTALSKGTQGTTKKQRPTSLSAPGLHQACEFPCGYIFGQLGTPFWQTQELACWGLHCRRKYTSEAARQTPGVKAPRSAFNPADSETCPGCPALPTSSGESPPRRPSNLRLTARPRAASHRLAAAVLEDASRGSTGSMLEQLSSWALRPLCSCPSCHSQKTLFNAGTTSWRRLPGPEMVRPSSLQPSYPDKLTCLHCCIGFMLLLCCMGICKKHPTR